MPVCGAYPRARRAAGGGRIERALSHLCPWADSRLRVRATIARRVPLRFLPTPASAAIRPDATAFFKAGGHARFGVRK